MRLLRRLTHIYKKSSSDEEELVAKKKVTKLESFESYRNYQLKKLPPMAVPIS